LTGTAEEKYQEWRRILREIFASETGLPQPVDSVTETPQTGYP
jgi:hypothetical protein